MLDVMYVEARKKLVAWLRRQMIGPAGEDILQGSPLDRYPVGVLSPVEPGVSGVEPASTDEPDGSDPAFPEDEEEEALGRAGEDTGEARPALPARKRRYAPPSSVGFSCFVRGEARLCVTASAARYRHTGETCLGPAGHQSPDRGVAFPGGVGRDRAGDLRAGAPARVLDAAAILFGAREGWLGLPLGLREPRALSATVSHRMARMAHRMAGTRIELGPAPPRIQPLREPFGDGSGWRVRENSAARLLTREQGWDCIRTRIKLGPGAYALEVNRGGAQIVLEGEPRAVESEIDRTRFFRHLAQERIPVKVEAKVREALTG